MVTMFLCNLFGICLTDDLDFCIDIGLDTPSFLIVFVTIFYNSIGHHGQKRRFGAELK